MKQNKEKKYAGVWLDNHSATIITNSIKEGNDAFSIQNKVKAVDHHAGGSEHSMNNAKKSDSRKYFKEVSGLLLNYDEILVFGPGKSQEELKNILSEDEHFRNTQITLDSTGQLTDPQMIAKVRDFFKPRL